MSSDGPGATVHDRRGQVSAATRLDFSNGGGGDFGRCWVGTDGGRADAVDGRAGASRGQAKVDCDGTNSAGRTADACRDAAKMGRRRRRARSAGEGSEEI